MVQLLLQYFLQGFQEEEAPVVVFYARVALLLLLPASVRNRNPMVLEVGEVEQAWTPRLGDNCPKQWLNKWLEEHPMKGVLPKEGDHLEGHPKMEGRPKLEEDYLQDMHPTQEVHSSCEEHAVYPKMLQVHPKKEEHSIQEYMSLLPDKQNTS